MIVIINGCGANITSVQFALERLGKKSVLTTDVDIIKSASHVILPGVGTAKHAMAQLQNLQLVDVIHNLTQPVLGICLGMQILYDFSKEGDIECLGILPGIIEPLVPNLNLRIPHMGWNQLQFNPSLLTAGINKESYVYFVHSYYAPINSNTLATTQYGVTFSAMVQSKNYYGMQFHPEKSGEVGERILRNFLRL